jgi:hypothetical protein
LVIYFSKQLTCEKAPPDQQHELTWLVSGRLSEVQDQCELIKKSLEIDRIAGKLLSNVKFF